MLALCDSLASWPNAGLSWGTGCCIDFTDSRLSAPGVLPPPLYPGTARSSPRALPRYETPRQEAHLNHPHCHCTDDFGFHTDVLSRIYTLEQMKRQESKYRFYLWDYLWWQGERLQQARPQGRVNGSFLLYGYIIALVILPLMCLSSWLFPDWFSPDNVMIHLIVWVVVVLTGYSWIERIYRRRGKAVLKHYSKHSFHEAVAVILVILSTAIMIFLMWLWDNCR